MSTVLWLGIGHYLLGILVVFAFVVALMETSRKFDRFHDNSFLMLATGYFLLVVWGLVRAIALNSGLLQLVASICLVVGLFCVALGYYIHHHAHPDDSDEDQPTPANDDMHKDEQKESKPFNFKEDWMKLLSAKDHEDGPVEEAEETDEPVESEEADKETPEEETTDEETSAEEIVKSEPEDKPEGNQEEAAAEAVEEAPAEIKEEAAPNKSKQKKPVEETPVEEQADEVEESEVAEPADSDGTEEIDLSYLMKRSERKLAKSVKKVALEPTSKPVKKDTVKKSTKVEEPIPEAPASPVKSTKAAKKREEIMDDLFPLAHQAKKKRAKKVSHDTLPGEGVHDAESA